MKTRSIAQTLADLPFFEGMSDDHMAFISGCASNVRFKEGALVLQQGRPADRFYLIREGRVALELRGATNALAILTVGEGDMLGWSWLLPPHTWHYDARTVTDVALIGFDAACVRKKCDDDPVFGYEMFRRFTQLIVDRLMATRLQIVDVYR